MGFEITVANLVNRDTFEYKFKCKLEALDLQSVAARLMHPEVGLGWSAKQVEFAIARYKMFLHLMYLYPKQLIIPTREIDLVWHFHILDTRKYAFDCEILFGYFLHHRPSSGEKSEGNKILLETAFTLTLELLKKHFGLSIYTQNYSDQSVLVINLEDKLQQPSACPDTFELLSPIESNLPGFFI